MRQFLCRVFLLIAIFAVIAKTDGKRKFDGDFEFAEEMSDAVNKNQENQENADHELDGSENPIEVMSDAAVKNRGNQHNPDHKSSGPGRPTGYKGKGDKADLDNHARQLDPQNELFQPKK